MQVEIMGVRVDVTNVPLSDLLPRLTTDFEESCIEVSRGLPQPPFRIDQTVDYVDRFHQSLLDVRHRTIVPLVPTSVSSVLHELMLPVANAWRLTLMGVQTLDGFICKLNNLGSLAVSVLVLQERAGQHVYQFSDFRSMWRESCYVAIPTLLLPDRHVRGPVFIDDWYNVPMLRHVADTIVRVADRYKIDETSIELPAVADGTSLGPSLSDPEVDDEGWVTNEQVAEILGVAINNLRVSRGKWLYGYDGNNIKQVHRGSGRPLNAYRPTQLLNHISARVSVDKEHLIAKLRTVAIPTEQLKK